MLQYVAVCCSVLQYIAVRERVHAKNATRAPGQRAKTNHLDVHSVCSVSLQHNATHCNTLQHTATHRNALVNRTCVNLSIYTFSVLQCVAVCCSVLQCVAVCCSLFDKFSRRAFYVCIVSQKVAYTTYVPRICSLSTL